MRDLLEAVKYLHNYGGYHGDTKPSNAMFTRDKQKKIDMSHANMARQVIELDNGYCIKIMLLGFRSTGQARQREDFQTADIWSIAATTLHWIGVQFDEDEKYLQSDVHVQAWIDTLLDRVFHRVPNHLFWDLIKKMLKVNPEERITINKAVQHPFWSKTKNRFFATLDKENAHPNTLVQE